MDIPCENTECGRTLHITGDGSTVTRLCSDGGHYFCSEDCANSWVRTNTSPCLAPDCSTPVVHGYGDGRCPTHAVSAPA